MEKAGLNTLLGMGTVFVVLIFISFLISLFKYIPAIQNAFGKKKDEKKEETKAAVSETVEEVDETDDLESVSYTHLDVYKRQDYLCLYRFGTRGRIYLPSGRTTGAGAWKK